MSIGGDAKFKGPGPKSKPKSKVKSMSKSNVKIDVKANPIGRAGIKCVRESNPNSNPGSKSQIELSYFIGYWSL